jgi:flagellin
MMQQAFLPTTPAQNAGGLNNNTPQLGSLLEVDIPPALDATTKTKVRELTLNEKYAQEAVAVSDAALAGLSEIKDNLDDIKKLVAQATEDIYTEADRETIQAEIDKKNNEITAIAKGTKYQDHNILDRERTADPEAPADEAATQPPPGIPIPQETAAGAPPNADDLAITPIPEDFVDKIFEAFDKRFGGLTSFTAEQLGTDKIDVSSAESAKEGLGIVDNAIGIVEEKMKQWQIFKKENSDYLELTVPEEEGGPNRPKLVNGAMEYLKNNLLAAEVKALLANSEQKPENVAYLLRK